MFCIKVAFKNNFCTKPTKILTFCYGKLFCNKFWELQIDVDFNYFFNIEIDALHPLHGRDHAGVYCNLTLFGLSFIFSIYDSRHWDTETNSWINTE